MMVGFLEVSTCLFFWVGFWNDPTSIPNFSAFGCCHVVMVGLDMRLIL